ncbi:MAG: bifunctional precorrin-2 dehydrogenase/sirohydrochlorin ferrochelatase [bacterium]
MKNLSAGSYFPILLDLSKFDIIIIGAGYIATRKVSNLIEFGASLKVIAPEISNEIIELSETIKIEILKRKYHYGDISYNSLVFCSTADSEADKLIQKECEEKHALLNVADVPELCNFIMPATIKHGDLTVSVSSQGRAPFLVKETRKRLSKLFSPQTADFVDIASKLRDKMMESEVYYDIEKREKIIKEFLEMDIEKIILEQGKETALKRAMELIPL